MAVRSTEVRALLVRWCDEQQPLYVVFFEPRGMQAITGTVTGVEEHVAIVTDKVIELRLPIDDPFDAFFTFRANAVHSLTISWPDGTSAFLVTR